MDKMKTINVYAKHSYVIHFKDGKELKLNGDVKCPAVTYSSKSPDKIFIYGTLKDKANVLNEILNRFYNYHSNYNIFTKNYKIDNNKFKLSDIEKIESIYSVDRESKMTPSNLYYCLTELCKSDYESYLEILSNMGIVNEC